MMNSYDFDFVILGGGCIGAAIFHEFAQRGFRNVALLDKGGKTVSATSRSAGMLRVFHESSEHMELALANQELLKLKEKSGILTAPATRNGSLYFFHRDRFASYQPNLRKMEIAGYPFETLTTAQGQVSFPQFRWDTEHWAVHEPEGGHLTPVTFTSDLLRDGALRGFEVHDDFEVRRVSRHLNRYRLMGDEATITTRTLIFAGGARMIPRLVDLGIGLPLETRTLELCLATKADQDFSAPNFLDRETLEFGRLSPGPQIVVSQAVPSRLHAEHCGSVVERFAAADCYAPGRVGIAGQVPGQPNLFLATGWGGTAFKFSLEVARRIADAAERIRPERRDFHAFP